LAIQDAARGRTTVSTIYVRRSGGTIWKGCRSPFCSFRLLCFASPKAEIIAPNAAPVHAKRLARNAATRRWRRIYPRAHFHALASGIQRQSCRFVVHV